MNSIKEMTSDEILAELSETQKDEIYRAVWAKYVEEDVRNRAEDRELTLNDDQVADIAGNYAYNGDYDCNLSYWDNIDNLIDDELGL